MSDKTITMEFIKSSYDKILSELVKIFPLSKWVHIPTDLTLTDHKTKYGMADSKGIVHINSSFIGSKSFERLENTLRHEFTHLAIGLHNSHNKTFKRASVVFGVKEISDDFEVRKAIGHKYTLFAQTESESIQIKNCHKRTKKYTEYGKNGRFNMSVDGKKIVSFKYVENS